MLRGPWSSLCKFVMLLRRNEKKMALQLPAEIVPQVNEIKANIDALNKRGKSVQSELDAISQQGVEIKLIVKSIDEINIEKIKNQFLAVTQSRINEIEKIQERIAKQKQDLAEIVTQALLG